MRISLIRISRWERLLAMAALLGAALVAIVLSLRPGWELFLLARPPSCLLKVFTGVPCLACRGTRAAVALAHGQLVQALLFNPLAVLFLTSVTIWLSWLACTGKHVSIRLSRPETVLFWLLFSAALLANWAYVIHQGG